MASPHLIHALPGGARLFYVFTGWAHTHPGAHFLFVPNLNDNPNHHLLAAGLPIPAIAYLIFPLLAGLTTLIQTRMLQMRPPPNPTEQELQTLQMQRTMLWISPLMIAYFALNVPAGLGLYWFIGNCVSIIQQSFVVGWGNLWPSRARPLPGVAPSLPASSKGLPNKLPPGGPARKNGPAPNANGPGPKKKAKNKPRSDLN
jgi:60Kd inner membrane protein